MANQPPIYAKAPALSHRSQPNHEYGVAPNFAQGVYDQVDTPLDAAVYENPDSALAGFENNYSPQGLPVSARASQSVYDRVDAPLAPADQYMLAPAPVGYGQRKSELYSPAALPAQANVPLLHPSHPLMRYTGPARMPQADDYQNAPFYQKSFDRHKAAQFLKGKPPGSFVLRPSSVSGCLGLTHVERDGSIGHGLVHMHSGNEGRYGYSIENSRRTYPTLPMLFATLPGLLLTQYGGTTQVSWQMK